LLYPLALTAMLRPSTSKKSRRDEKRVYRGFAETALMKRVSS